MSLTVSSVAAREFFARNLPTLVVGMILCALYSYFFAFKATVVIDIETFHDKKTFLEFFWARDDQPFSANKVSRVRINKRSRLYSVTLPNVSSIDKLRIDPIQYGGDVRLRGIQITQPGYRLLRLGPEEIYHQLKPANQIRRYDLTPADGVELSTIAQDGQLVMAFEMQPSGGFWSSYIVHLLLIMGLTLVLGYSLGYLQTNLLFVPIFMLVVFSLAISMIAISKNGAHPDEIAHTNVINFFTHNVLPPAADAPELAYTYTHYGNSRANNFEIYYLLAGTFARLTEPFKFIFFTDARIFSLTMLGILLLLSIHIVEFRPFMVPFLITPQAWYFFSYANSDGYALLISILVAYQAACRTSSLNRFLTEAEPRRFWLSAVALGLLIGSQFLIKVNFATFVLFLGLYFLWRLAIGDFKNKPRLWTRLGIVLVIGFSLYGARLGWDIAVNGFDRKARLAEMQIHYGNELYSADTPLEKQHYNMHLKARGVTMAEMFTLHRWGGRVYITAFGGYGSTEFMGSDTFYRLVRTVGLLLLAALLISILVRAPPGLRVLFAITVFSVLSSIVLAFWSNWVNIMQPQGRYFAPVLPMLGILYYHIRPHLYDRVVNALVVAMFALGVYSYVFVGLANIPKVSWAIL